MNRMIERLAPHATQLVRTDHGRLLQTFHRYRVTASPRVRRGLVRSVCLALEVHAQLEEELLYPAVREAISSEFLREAVSQHDEMRRRIAQLRQLPAEDPSHDATFMALIRDVIHHVADEETQFLPEAERVLRGRLGELGARMMRRRLALMAPRSPALVVNGVRSVPPRSLAMAAAIVLGGVWLGHQLSRRAASPA